MNFIDKIRVKDVSYAIQDTDARKSIENLDNNKADKKEIPTDYATNNDIQDINTYLDAITPKSSAKGELVHITDALGLPVFETKTSGNVKQETTKGQQLFNYKDTTTAVYHTVDKDDFITWTFDNTDSSTERYLNIWTTKSDSLKENTAYKVILEIKNISQLDKTKYSYLNLIGSEPETQFSKSAVKMIKEYTKGIYIFDTLTKESFEERTLMTRNFLAIAPGDSVSITFRLSVVEDTTVTPETFVYEKFTRGQASPNPEFPQEVEVLEAYNRFNINTITENKYIDGSTGEIVNSSASNISDYIEIEANKPFSLSYYYNTLMVIAIRTIAYYDADENFLKGIPYDPVNKLITLTPPNGAKFVRFSYDKNCYDIQLVKGTKEKPYNPFSCISYKNNGNNWFNDNKFVKDNFNNVVEVENGYTFDVIKNKSIYTIEKAKPNTQYIFKGRISSSIGADLYIHFNYTDGTKKFGVEIIKSGAFDTTFNLTTDGTKTLQSIEFGMYGYGNYKTYTFKDFMLSEVDDAYEPYQEQIFSLDLKGNWVGKISDDIKDYLVTDKKRLWLVKNVGKVVLDGSENWISDETNRFYIVKNALIDKGIITQTPSIIYSNRFIYKETAWSGKGTMGISVSGALWCVMTDNFSITSVLDFKTWLSNNNVELYYQLAKPQIIELGELPEPIKTFEGVNNIQLLANLDTEIEVKYALDLKKYYDNKLAEISAQII